MHSVEDLGVSNVEHLYIYKNQAGSIVIHSVPEWVFLFDVHTLTMISSELMSGCFNFLNVSPSEWIIYHIYQPGNLERWGDFTK